MPPLLVIALLCAAGSVHAQGFAFRGHADECSREPIELMWELSAAVESGDVNRVAALYDWNGMGTRASRRIMDRLEALSARMLVDVVPVYPPAPPDPAGIELPPWPAELTLSDEPPVALRVEQLVPGTSTAVSTTFALRRRMGCWWVAF